MSNTEFDNTKPYALCSRGKDGKYHDAALHEGILNSVDPAVEEMYRRHAMEDTIKMGFPPDKAARVFGLTREHAFGVAGH